MIDHRTDFGFERRQLRMQKLVELRHVRREHREDAGEARRLEWRPGLR